MNTFDNFKVGDRVKVNDTPPGNFSKRCFPGSLGTVADVTSTYVRVKIDGVTGDFTEPLLPDEIDKVAEDVVVSDESEFFTLAELKEKYDHIAALYEQGFRLLKENS